jgi:adenosylmethionine---8-amino-7-oxononanoate aminotransferase
VCPGCTPTPRRFHRHGTVVIPSLPAASPGLRSATPRAGAAAPVSADLAQSGRLTAEVGSLTELDRRHVWHPYSPMPTVGSMPVDSAQGVRVRLVDGRELIDGMASWWCAVHGYRHPILDGAVRRQLDRMAHVMFGGLTHAPAIRLATRLAELSPDGLEHVFFADCGSVAVEVAIKMCLQYWLAVGRPERRRLLTIRGGYHGDTFGAVAVCDPVGGMHSLSRECWRGTCSSTALPRVSMLRSISATQTN